VESRRKDKAEWTSEGEQKRIFEKFLIFCKKDKFC